MRNRNAASAPKPPLNRPTTSSVNPTVVTEQRNFFRALCQRPGCHEHPAPVVHAPTRYCGPSCREAFHRVRDRERKWLSRRTLDGQEQRAREYRRQRRRPHGDRSGGLSRVGTRDGPV